jgi:hypothetical protein
MLRRKVLLLASLAVLALLLAFGCSLLPREDTGTGTGWYIKLQIKAPEASKGITVTDFDVTGLKIQVRDPEGEVLKTIDWAANEGLQTYLVPVKEQGVHEIEVTHFGEREGQQVQATEKAAFNIRAMGITVIDVVPGGIGLIWVEGGGPPLPVDLTGYWDAILTPAGGETNAPHLLYMKQTGSSLNGSGITGTIEGSAVAIASDDGEIALAGTIAPDGRINGTYEGFGTTGTFELRRSDLTFGTFALSGIIDLNTDRGLAAETDWNACDIDYMDEDLNVGLNLCSWFGPITTGTFLVPDQVGVQVYQRFDDESGFDAEATSGSLVITSYEEGVGIEGHFENMMFSEGALSGNFNVSFALNGYN